MRLLFIEDDSTAVQPIMDKLESDHKHECRCTNFPDCRKDLLSFQPNVIVLDLFEGSDDIAGQPKYEEIWKEYYCPIIVYSAHPEAIDTKRNNNHPFLALVQKGSDYNELINKINGFGSSANALETVYEKVKQDAVTAMRSLAPVIKETGSNHTDMTDQLLRAGRRRIASIIDQPMDGCPSLSEWEMYIWPPIVEDFPLMGDILRQDGGANEHPGSYRVVLTPSCDLVKSDERPPKVKDVLVAKCVSITDGLKKTSLWNKIIGKTKNLHVLKEKIPDSVFNDGRMESVMFLPELKGHFPGLALNLKELELIPYDEIGLKEKKYIRVASVDSPFRERISWTFTKITGRPGVPDIDRSSWKESFLNQFIKEQGDD